MKLRRVRAAAALLLALGMAAVPAAQDTKAISGKEFAKLIDKDALLFVSVRDVDKLRENLDKAGLKELMDNKQVKEFIDYVKQKMEEASAGQESPFKDFPVSEILEAAGGEVAFAVGPADLERLMKESAEGGPPEPATIKAFAGQFALLVNGKGKADAFQKLVDKVVSFAVEKGARKGEETYKGAKLTTLSPPDAGDLGIAPTFARIGSVFILSPTVDGAKDPIKRSDEGAAESLASNPNFSTLAKAVGPDADALAYVNLDTLLRALKKAAEIGADQSGQPIGDFIDDLWEGFGLDGPKAFGMGASFRADQAVTRAYLHAPDGLKGLLKGIFPKTDNPSVPDFVPANAHGFYTTRYDFKSMYETMLEDIIGPIAKSYGYPAEMLVENAEGFLGISLEGDLFGNLTGEVTTVSRYEGAESVGVTALGAKSIKNFETAFKKLVEVAQQQSGGRLNPEDEDYVGGRLFTFGEQVPMAMGLKEKSIFLGPTASVKEAMRLVGKGEPTLADDATFKALAKLLPAGYQSVGYTAKEGFVRALTSLKKGEFLQGLPGGRRGGLDPAQIQEAFDFSKIPDAEILTRNLVGLIGYSEQTAEGVQWVTIAKLTGK